MQEIPRRKTVTVDPMRPTTIRVSDIKKMIRSLVASVMICAASAFQAPMVKHARFSQFWLSIRQPPEYVQVFDFLIGWMAQMPALRSAHAAACSSFSRASIAQLSGSKFSRAMQLRGGNAGEVFDLLTTDIASFSSCSQFRRIR